MRCGSGGGFAKKTLGEKYENKAGFVDFFEKREIES